MWIYKKLCGHSRAARKEHLRTIRVRITFILLSSFPKLLKKKMIDNVFLSEKEKHMENSRNYRSHHRSNSLFPEKTAAGNHARCQVSKHHEEPRKAVRNCRAKKNRR